MSMQVYTAAALSPSAWPEPFETAYQMQRRHGPAVPGARRPDITYGQRLLIASVVNLWAARPHGALAWLADVHRTSRQTIYDIGARWDRRRPVVGAAEAPTAAPAPIEDEPAPSTRNQFARAVLTLRFPGGTSLRPMEACLDEPLGETRSATWLSIFLNEVGERAGRVLDKADWSAVKPFIATRDEKFFHDWAYLLTVEPQSLAVVSGHVEDGVDGDRWAVSLALDQDKTGHAITALAEDAAKWYPSSLKEAAALLGTRFLLLWHCMRRFERGKRKGRSPFQIAGVRVFDPDGNETDDWLAALGYPAAT